MFFSNFKRFVSRTAPRYEAHLFQMPAMSPTMETGGVVAWKVKEGDAFASGDQLLEVETDKATIAVDAIDDGVLVKILHGEGAKDLPVGTPIAITADPEDDLATLKLPDLPEDAPVETQEVPKVPDTPKRAIEQPDGKSDPSQVFLPSVELMLHHNGISRAEAIAQIHPTGPKGRILKGDVMAFLGKIPVQETTTISNYIQSLSHLDLSHIELRKDIPSAEETTQKVDEAAKVVKPIKKEPVVVSREFIMEAPIKDQPTLAKIIRQAEIDTYAITASKSDLDDPLFDQIIAPTVDRFTIGYTMDKSIITFNLTLNEKAYDAKDKAQLFLKSIQSHI